MQALARVGILDRSSRAAARFVANLLNDPDSWWAKPEAQLARNEFVANYASFSSNRNETWELEFRSAIEGSS
jgi:putative transferase (TIGR04331 family)